MGHKVSKTSVLLILKKEKAFPFKAQSVLYKDHPHKRMKFSDIHNLIIKNNSILKIILFSDEATFCLNESINRQNCKYQKVNV